MIDGWSYYNHAALPKCAPHEEPDTAPIKNGAVFRNCKEGLLLFARWTTDWDCGSETSGKKHTGDI